MLEVSYFSITLFFHKTHHELSIFNLEKCYDYDANVIVKQSKQSTIQSSFYSFWKYLLPIANKYTFQDNVTYTQFLNKSQ